MMFCYCQAVLNALKYCGVALLDSNSDPSLTECLKLKDLVVQVLGTTQSVTGSWI